MRVHIYTVCHIHYVWCVSHSGVLQSVSVVRACVSHPWIHPLTAVTQCHGHRLLWQHRLLLSFSSPQSSGFETTLSTRSFRFSCRCFVYHVTDCFLSFFKILGVLAVYGIVCMKFITDNKIDCKVWEQLWVSDGQLLKQGHLRNISNAALSYWAPCGAGAPLFPLSIYFLIFSHFTFSFLSLALPIFFFCPSLPFLP